MMKTTDNAMDKVLAAKKLGDLDYETLAKAILDDFHGQNRISALTVEDKNGNIVLSVSVSIIEPSYECFSFHAVVTGPNGWLYNVAEGRMVDDRAYVQHREQNVTGSPENVDEFIRAHADDDVTVRLVEDPQYAARLQREANRAEQGRTRPDSEIAAKERTYANEYADKVRHAVNAIRKGCSADYIRDICNRARAAMDLVKVHTEYLDDSLIQLRRQDIDKAWTLWHQWYNGGYRASYDVEYQVIEQLKDHKAKGGLTPRRALQLICYACEVNFELTTGF